MPTAAKAPVPVMPAPAESAAFEVTMVVAKETPGTYRYAEVITDQPEVLGSLYLKKHAALKCGATIKVLVTTA